MSFKNIKNIPNNIVVRQGYSGLNFPLKLGTFVPKIINQPFPLSRSLNPGLSTVLTIEVAGFEPLFYQWYKGSISNAITGANTSSLTLTGITIADENDYFVIVSNAFGTVRSSDVSILVNQLVAITSGPQSLTAYYLNESAHDKATFSISTSGTLPITYAWYKNASVITGATTSVYVASYTLADSGAEYIASVQNFSTPVTAKATLTVLDTPLNITTQPVSSTVNPGLSSITLSVAATGRLPISYQWRKNGTELLGLTTQNLTIINVQESDQAQYDAVVSNLSGLTNVVVTLTSNAVLIDVNDPVVILADLSSELYFGMGETITLSAQVSGTAPISYQWYKDSNEIVGANSSTYSITVTAESDLGQFYFIASNIVNSVTSNTGVLYPAYPAGIVLPTTSQSLTANPNSNVNTMYVYASGTAPISYQWYKNETLIPLATSTIYNILSVAEGDEGEYKVVVSNNWASVTSVSFNLSVNNPVSFSEPLSGNEILMPGTEVVLYTVADGTPPINYQWFRNDSLLVGATLSSYTIASITPEENGDQYQVAVSNIVNTVSSNVVTLSVYQPVTITQQPVDIISAFNATNDEATFTVTVTGSTPYAYNWYKDGNSVYTGGSSYTVDNGRALSTTDFGTYFVTISNIITMVTSNNVALGGSVPFVVLETPVSLTTYDGSSAEFRARAVGGDGTILYQWYRNDIILGGANLSSYVVNPVSAGVNDGTYKVNISSVRGEAIPEAVLSSYAVFELWDLLHPSVALTLSAFTVTVTSGNIPFVFWGDGAYNTNVTSGSSIDHVYAPADSVGFTQNLTPIYAYFEVGVTGLLSSFSVVASGTDVRYEWYLKNGVGPTTLIPGASSSSYTFDSTSYSINSLLLFSRIYNSINSVTSLTAQIDVNNP
jgi:hypothetical protein